MKILFLALQQFLLSHLTGWRVNYIRIWNNQLQDMIDGTFVAEAATYNEAGVTPFIFVEFVSPMNINTLGNGDQVYEDLYIKLHFIFDFRDAQDGTMEQNLQVLDFSEDVYFALQDWMPSIITINSIDYTVPVGSFMRVAEDQDFDHSNLYHFVQTYKTNFIDSKRNRPIQGQLSDINTALQTNVNI